MPSRITCAHCNTEFTPESGVAFDSCPVCGRTVEVNPAPHSSDYRCGKCNRVWHADNGAEPCPWCRLAELKEENAGLHEEVSQRVKAAIHAESREDKAIRSAEAAEAERDKALLSKYAPLGDNHHNAWACPHCNEGKVTPAELTARVRELEAELRNCAETVRMAFGPDDPAYVQANAALSATEVPA